MSSNRLAVVVVPAYDERETIGPTIAGLRALEGSLRERGIDLCVYVVDDGSTDGTREAAAEAGADRVLRHRVNQGLGAAVRTGLAAARADSADFAVKFDADLQHDPEDVPRLLDPILGDEADIVYGNRFERIEYRMPLVRRAGNFVFTSLMRWLTKWPVRDGQPGIFAVSGAYLEVFRIPGDYNYTQQVLLDAYHKGMRFATVSVTFKKRAGGRSFISLRYPFKVLSQIFLVLVGLKPLRVFGTFGFLFLLAAASIGVVEVVDFLQGRAIKPIMHVNAVLGLALFGLQTFFFGLLAELIVRTRE